MRHDGGGRLTIGHIAIGIALSYLDFRFGDLRGARVTHGWRRGMRGSMRGRR